MRDKLIFDLYSQLIASGAEDENGTIDKARNYLSNILALEEQPSVITEEVILPKLYTVVESLEKHKGRISNMFRNNDITSTKALLEHSWRDLLVLKNFGLESLEYLEKSLRVHGLQLEGF